MANERIKSMLEMGYCFQPSNIQLIKYLLRFLAEQELQDSGFITTNVDVYGDQEPQEIYTQGVVCADDEDEYEEYGSYRYYITKPKANSNWIQQGEQIPVTYEQKTQGEQEPELIRAGWKKRMRHVSDQDKDRDYWLMTEYALTSAIREKFDVDRRDYVLCAIKKKGAPKPSTEGGLDEMNESASEDSDADSTGSSLTEL